MAGGGIGYKVTGLQEIRAAIRQAAPELRKEFKDVYRNTALAVAGRAYQLAPKYTGDLAGSIRPMATLTSASVSAGNSGVEYAGPIHWGWPKRNIRSQPFIADALEQQWDAITGYFDAAIDRVGQKITTD
jgi:hypothetical protein